MNGGETVDLETLVLVVFVTCLGAFSLAVFLTFLQSWRSESDDRYIKFLEDASWKLVKRNEALEERVQELEEEWQRLWEGGMEQRVELDRVEEISDQQMKEIRLLEDKAEKYLKYWQQMAVERDKLQIRVRELEKNQAPPVRVWADLEAEADERIEPTCEICGQPLEDGRKYTCQSCWEMECSYEEWLEGLAGG